MFYIINEIFNVFDPHPVKKLIYSINLITGMDGNIIRDTKIKTKSTMDNNELLMELMNKQLKNVDPKKKLQYSDLARICKYIKTSIFDENQCCIWNGYVTNLNKSCKGTYINFYFKNKKAALHRLLYINFISDLSDDEYLKFNCENKGNCCNITHLKKFKYNSPRIKKTDSESKKSNKLKKSSKGITITNSSNCDKNILRLTFD